MKLSLVVAVDLDRGIGKDGGIPWHLRSDLQRFKRITMGHTILMGRKTYQSIGRALPGRTSIIVSRDPSFNAPGCTLVDSFENGIITAKQQGQAKIFIIGGAQIFTHALVQAQEIHLTIVHTRADCQVFFPHLNWKNWGVVHQEFVPQSNQDEFSSVYYWLNHN